MKDFYFDKNIPSDVSRYVHNLEGLFQRVFQQMIYFQQRLNPQSGKAATALKKNLNEHLEFMSKGATVLLSFADVVQLFMTAIELTDDGILACTRTPSRAAWQYAFSPTRIEETIQIEPGPIEEATSAFESNLTELNEVFHKFNTMMNQIIDRTKIPWEDVDSVWSESKNQMTQIIEEMKTSVKKLKKDSHLLVTELKRIDQHAALKMTRV